MINISLPVLTLTTSPEGNCAALPPLSEEDPRSLLTHLKAMDEATCGFKHHFVEEGRGLCTEARREATVLCAHVGKAPMALALKHLHTKGFISEGEFERGIALINKSQDDIYDSDGAIAAAVQFANQYRTWEQDGAEPDDEPVLTAVLEQHHLGLSEILDTDRLRARGFELQREAGAPLVLIHDLLVNVFESMNQSDSPEAALASLKAVLNKK